MNEDYGIREARRSFNARTVLPDWQQVAEMCGRKARIFHLVSRFLPHFSVIESWFLAGCDKYRGKFLTKNRSTNWRGVGPSGPAIGAEKAKADELESTR